MPTSEPLITPFAALRPTPASAPEVIAPPYDVVDREQASRLAAARRHSFLHISRAEIDVSATTSPYDAQVYAKAAANLQALIDAGILVSERTPSFYVYQIQQGSHQQTGLAAAVSVAAYQAGRVRRHELTRPDKEDDRVRQIQAVGYHSGPALLLSQDHADLQHFLQQQIQQPSLLRAELGDTTHQIWPVSDAAQVSSLMQWVDSMPRLYIADGHHRISAASRLRDQGAGRFLGVIFPQSQLRILGYHRVVKDLNGLSEAEFLRRLTAGFEITPIHQRSLPPQAGIIHLCLAQGWFRLSIRSEHRLAPSAADRLDTSCLTRLVLDPLLDIKDIRRDPRIEFVGGQGQEAALAVLESLVKAKSHAAAFCLYPTAMAELLQVADAEELMPPKSTWFEPKLADGLLSLAL